MLQSVEGGEEESGECDPEQIPFSSSVVCRLVRTAINPGSVSADYLEP